MGVTLWITSWFAADAVGILGMRSATATPTLPRSPDGSRYENSGGSGTYLRANR